mmetsp:Transcript_85806/g.229559  ORF Transcript_85806/g.229559 Transcript_85806/m.229559 type:complete len:214 (-) Transcript_85806:107-748(-)
MDVPHRLRRHVAQGPHPVRPNDVRGVIPDRLGDPEINQLQPPPDQQKICGLQVTVHDALRVNHPHRLKHLLPESPELLHGELGAAGEQAGEVGLPVLQEQEEPALGWIHLRIHELDDVGAAPEGLEGGDFRLEALEELGVRGAQHPLQRQDLPLLRHHLVDSARPALPQQPHPGVPLAVHLDHPPVHRRVAVVGAVVHRAHACRADGVLALRP